MPTYTFRSRRLSKNREKFIALQLVYTVLNILNCKLKSFGIYYSLDSKNVSLSVNISLEIIFINLSKIRFWLKVA